jgi:hypothetical protein
MKFNYATGVSRLLIHIRSYTLSTETSQDNYEYIILLNMWKYAVASHFKPWRHMTGSRGKGHPATSRTGTEEGRFYPYMTSTTERSGWPKPRPGRFIQRKQIPYP